MNAIPKLVASRTLDDVGAWSNSTLLDGDLLAEAAARKAESDIVVVGSATVAHALIGADLVDEYRLLVFPRSPAMAPACSSRRAPRPPSPSRRRGPPGRPRCSSTVGPPDAATPC